VFGPLEMTSTLFYDDHERIVPNRAYSYRLAPDGIRKSVLSYANAGATSLFTTVNDLARWLDNFRTGRVGGLEGVARLVEPGVLTDGEVLDYALGISTASYRGAARLGHGGADAGYRTYAGYFPEHDLGVIVLSNHASFNPTGKAMDIVDLVIGPVLPEERPSPNVASRQESDWPQPSSEDLWALEGRYYSAELDTAYDLLLSGETLIARHHRHPDILLSPRGEDHFRGAAWFFGDVRIERDENGEPVGFRITSGRVRNLFFQLQP
jgi:CubicO group peptidase (beta-lactamase class C family)